MDPSLARQVLASILIDSRYPIKLNARTPLLKTWNVRLTASGPLLRLKICIRLKHISEFIIEGIREYTESITQND